MKLEGGDEPWLLIFVVLGMLACGPAAPEPEPSPAVSAQPLPRDVGGLSSAAPDGVDRPELMTGIGNSSLAITTRSLEAQKYFDQGLNLLHCYWDFEAHRAFKEAARLDPSAAMAHWGIYMSLSYNQREHLEERLGALRRAEDSSPTASELERRMIRAIVAINRPGNGQAAYVREMESLIRSFPGALEPKLFLVKFLLTETGGYLTDEARGEGRFDAIEKAQAILRPLLASHPDHLAVHHYWVHAHEYGPDPGAALESALRLPSLAPNSGHVLHMPGHVWFQIGEYEKALEAFENSLEFDRRYLAETGVDPVDNWNYVHNLDYLVAAAAESGRYEQGRAWAEIVQSLDVGAGRHHAVGSGFALYGGRTALARLHMRFGAWDRAVESLEALAGADSPSPLAARYFATLAIYARGMSAVSRGLVNEAAAHLERLLDANLDLRHAPTSLGADWYFDSARRILAVSSFELAGALLSLQGRHEQAIAQLERTVAAEADLGYWEPPHVARPALESLADAYSRAGRWEEARRTYDRVLELRPKSGHAKFGIARTFVLEGRKREARQAMLELLEAWPGADEDLPQVYQTRVWLQANP